MHAIVWAGRCGQLWRAPGEVRGIAVVAAASVVRSEQGAPNLWGRGDEVVGVPATVVPQGCATAIRWPPYM